MHKKVLAMALISNPLPELLANEVYETVDDCVYWVFESIKWYPDYEDIRAVQEFFNYLDDLNNGKSFNDADPLYGAMRMGENDDDFEVWGDPYEFGIESVRDITYPV